MENNIEQKDLLVSDSYVRVKIVNFSIDSKREHDLISTILNNEWTDLIKPLADRYNNLATAISGFESNKEFIGTFVFPNDTIGYEFITFVIKLLVGYNPHVTLLSGSQLDALNQAERNKIYNI